MIDRNTCKENKVKRPLYFYLRLIIMTPKLKTVTGNVKGRYPALMQRSAHTKGGLPFKSLNKSFFNKY